MPRIRAPKKWKRKGKELVNAIPNDYDGIHFESLQETNAYKKLKPVFGDSLSYTPKVFSIHKKNSNNKIIWQKPKQGGGLMKEVKRLTHIEYTPDFIVKHDEVRYWIIEVKGKPNPSWEFKKRVFMHYIQDKPEILGFFECSSIKQVEQVINLIQNYND